MTATTTTTRANTAAAQVLDHTAAGEHLAAHAVIAVSGVLIATGECGIRWYVMGVVGDVDVLCVRSFTQIDWGGPLKDWRMPPYATPTEAWEYVQPRDSDQFAECWGCTRLVPEDREYCRDCMGI